MSMAQHERPLSPFLHYRWQYTNTLSILHRITGVLLSFGFFILVYWLAAAAGGPERYDQALRLLSSPLMQIILLGAVFAFCFHLLNGIRHLFFDLGRGFDLKTARSSGWATAVGALVLALLVWVLLTGALGGVA
jgi:succinate dehydrogenase / fumarate reductase cytochrome b subunit